MRSSAVTEEMIVDIIEKDPTGESHRGEPMVFKRRRPEESSIDFIQTLEHFFDRIGTLDAEGYPHAFLSADPFLLQLALASSRNGKLVADCTITVKEER